MKEIVSSPNLVAYCGLYCGACASYLRERCPGCHENEKASWCKIRVCANDNEYPTCADCKEFDNPADCKKFSNFMSKLFALVFRSDRKACIEKIKKIGIQEYADYMAKNGLQSLKK